MTRDSDDAVEVLRSVWSAQGTTSSEVDEDFPAKKVCRNMKDVSFDGMAEPGSDLREAWRERLEREGKLSTSGGSIRDLVLGHDAPH
jgi:predicted metal-dependent phosphoesterase TrpH